MGTRFFHPRLADAISPLYSNIIRVAKMSSINNLIMTSSDCKWRTTYRGIFADVIFYIFAHLHRALRTEGNTVDIN